MEFEVRSLGFCILSSAIPTLCALCLCGEIFFLCNHISRRLKRICRLAPLYLDVLDALGMRPYVVFTVRHPVEVIRSISERNDLDPATIELLWLRHVLEAETASRSCRRVWTSYDQLLNSWVPTAQSIAPNAALEILLPMS